MASPMHEPPLPAVSDLRVVFQPIVDLDDNRVVGFEALARRRDPFGHWVAPTFSDVDDATTDDDETALDWACRTLAMSVALESEEFRSTALFMNAEARTRTVLSADAAARRVLARARDELQVVVEITERALLARPASVLRLARWARDQGWGVAVDDVGANPDSLAMLPFIAPDVIKLDLALIQNAPNQHQAHTITAVLAHVERSGALVVAEGIETPAHLERARSLGASLGQGWLFGRPAPLRGQALS